MSVHSGVYEVRRGWTVRAAVTVGLALAAGLAMIFGGFAVRDVKLVVLGAFLVSGGGIDGWNVLRRRLVVRVDEQGITLARNTLLGRASAPIPWSQVQTVVAFKRRMRSELGVVKVDAGIPANVFTPGGVPWPDAAVPVVFWKLDLPALAAAVHAYAPDLRIFDERRLDAAPAAPAAAADPPQRSADPGLRRRQTMAAGVGVVLLGVLLTVLAVNSSRGPAGYAVQAGPRGQAVDPVLPQQFGDQMLLMADGSPEWKYYPNLLPSGPTSSFGLTTGIYASATPSPSITVDAVFAREQADGVHRGVFSLSPHDLVALVNSAMGIGDAEPYPAGGAGSDGAVLECGTYATQPQCAWADDDTFVIFSYFGTPGTEQQLAALVPGFIQQMTGD